MQISAQMKQQRGCEAAPAFEYALDNLILHRYNTKITTTKKARHDELKVPEVSTF